MLIKEHQGTALRSATSSSPQFMEHQGQTMYGICCSRVLVLCGLTLSEVEPGLYVKIVVDDRDCAKDLAHV